MIADLRRGVEFPAAAATQTIWGDGCRKYKLSLPGEACPESATRFVRQVRVFRERFNLLFISGEICVATADACGARDLIGPTLLRL